jgi:hypothetical protein
MRSVLCVTWIVSFLLCSAGSLADSSPSSAQDAWGGIRLFEADLSAGNQTTLTQSNGQGFAKVKLDINSMEITWEVEFNDLTSPPTGIHLHGPAQPGTNAVAIIDLGMSGLSSPIKGSVKASDAHVQYMLLGWTYVLIKTNDYPNGELRGKLDTVPPAGFSRTSRRQPD